MNRWYKIIGWHVLVALCAWWLWTVGQHATFNAITGIDIQIPSLSAFLFLTAIIVLGYIMFQQRRWSLSISGIIGLFFMLTFGWTWLNSLAVVAVLLFNLWSANRVRREINERRVLNIPDAFYHGLMPVVLGLFVMVSFAAYQSPLLAQIKTADQLPNQAKVFFQQIVESTVGQKIQAATPTQRQQLISEISSQTFQQFNQFLKPYFQYAPPVLAFGLFLILWGLSFLFVWLAAAVGLFLFWVLKKVRVVRIEEKDVKAQVLVI